MIGLCNVSEPENQCLNHLYSICALEDSMDFIRTKGWDITCYSIIEALESRGDEVSKYQLDKLVE